MSLTITPVNDAPIAVNDSDTVAEGATEIVNLTPIGNDSDSDDGLKLDSISIVGAPTNGAIVGINGDGTVDYQHDGSETNSDSFTYTIDDNSGVTSNIATVSLTISPVNDNPVAVDDVAGPVQVGTTFTIDLAANDYDVDNALNLTSIVITTQPNVGIVVDNDDGTVDYTHDGSTFFDDTFSYTIDDAAGATSNIANVSVSIGLCDPATEVEFEGFCYYLDGSGGECEPGYELAPQSILSIIADDFAGKYVKTQNSDNCCIWHRDIDTELEDWGAGSNSCNVVGPFQNGPELDGYSCTNANNRNALQFTLCQTSPVQCDPVTEVEYQNRCYYLDGSGGTCEPGYELAPQDVLHDIAAGFVGLHPKTQICGNCCIWHRDIDDEREDWGMQTDCGQPGPWSDGPGEGANGCINVDIRWVDQQTLCGSQLINNPPTANNDSGTVAEGGSVNINLAANDTDDHGQLNLASINIVSGPSQGAVVVNADGTVDYDHGGDEPAAESFEYTISDHLGVPSNVATVTISITEVNDPPFADDDSGTVAEGGQTTTTVVNGDTDVDGTIVPATVTIVTGPNAWGSLFNNGNGTIRYTHDGSENHSDSYTYKVKDNDNAWSNDATVTITVTPVNDAPTAVDDDASVDEGGTVNIDVAGNDTDPDSGINADSVAIITWPSNGWINAIYSDGTVDYEHDGSETVSDSFTYTIDDVLGATSNTATVSITVNPVNDPPVVTDVGDQTYEDWETVSLDTGATDIENDNIVFTATGLPPDLWIDPNTGLISGTLSPDSIGTHSVTVFATDDGTPPEQGADSFDIDVVQRPDCTTIFEEVTAESNLPNDGFLGAAWFDVNNDGHLDVLLKNQGLYINQGDGTFNEESAARGIADLGGTGFASIAIGDLEGDGDFDVFIGDSSNKLYINWDGAGNFSDQTANWGLGSSYLAAGFIDYDADGDLDFLGVSNSGAEMWRNDGDVPPFSNDNINFDTALSGQSFAWADYDGDRDLDLYITTLGVSPMNKLFRNSNNYWEEIAASVGAEGPGTAANWANPTWVDIDNDGDLDIHAGITLEGTDKIFYNNRESGSNTFTEAEASATGLANTWGNTGPAWADYDQDGDLDVYINGSGLFANNGDGTFTDVSADTGV
ncbi:MAG: tandem-95 repeat protein, partial [Proteobacteria bacterium]|nr:tandem-95 repeat protein [Pseudomonadota bacterium]